MATSGTITGTVTGNSAISSRITWTLNSQSVANNTSSVTVSLAYKRSDSQTTWGDSGYCHWKLTINGTAYTSTAGASISSSWVTVFSKTVTITHDANGAKTFSMSAAGSYISGSSLEGTNCSGSGTLTTIPRASTLNSVTSSVNLGANVSISITAKASTFYHKATWTCGSVSVTQNLGKINKTTAVSYSYTIPTTWASQISTATSKTASVKVQTYSDSGYKTAVGSAVSKNFTILVPDTATYKPSVTLNTVLGNETGLGSSKYVQGKTTITLNATGGSAGNGASIKSYTFKRSSTALKTVTTTAASASASETTNTANNVEYSVTITDSRGRTATASSTITVYAYLAPTLTVTGCFRSNSSGTKDTTSGKNIHINATYTYSSAGGNAATGTVQYKLSTASTYGAATSLTNGGTGTTVGNDSISANKTYDVLVSVKDTVGTTVSRTFKIPTSFVTMDFKAGGTGVAVGKIAEYDDMFDISMKMRLNGTTDNEAKIIMLSSGFNDRELIYSNAGNIGFRDITDNNTWLLRIDSDKNAFIPGDNFTLGESSDTTTKDLFLENNVRKVTFSLNSNGNTGLYHSGTGWIIRADTNNNVSIPSGTFSAPKSIAHGRQNITTVANTYHSVAVNFGTTLSSSSPNVVATAYSGVPGSQVIEVSVGDRSATGCTLWVYRTNASTMSVDWIAMG